jgi:hypothetical protein
MRWSPRNKAAVLLLAAAVLSGCADYMNRRDSVTLRAGNAAEANTAIHTVNPWPAGVMDPRL